MTQRTVAPRNECRTALIAALRKSAPLVAVDDKGYVANIRENLVEGVQLEDFEADLRQGDGGELERKFRAAHSSCALAVNTFAPFKAAPASLRLTIAGRFGPPQFECKCPTGLQGKPPNLDLVVEGPAGVVAIESKCLEHLGPQIANFRASYERDIVDGRRDGPWFAAMRKLADSPRHFRWLDAAQLVKHAFGLAHTFPDRAVTLLYIYWEPSNRDAFDTFIEHRREVDAFADWLADSKPGFEAMSYSELWSFWESLDDPLLTGHVRKLRTRYEVEA